MNKTLYRPGILILALLAAPAQAGWLDKLKEQVLGGGPVQDQAAAALGSDEIAAGLKQALEKGVRSAVDLLGRTDGFLGNPKVRIPMPDHLQRISSGLRTLGQDKYADEFERTMNRAAEAAVPEAKAIFMEAIRGMTLEDAKAILDGPDDAATQYFRKTGEQRLRARMLPVVQEATARVGVTNAYNNLVKNLDFLGGMVDTKALDLNDYVTTRALDGLFLMIAEEEKRIRENPVERTTDLLKKVFGSLNQI
ncbi:MAG TPA: DUF4197 domain-containing protein [Sedimenticola sp.]|nr:DUF4197 domain-containing protein [Sedimenticola sp.]